MKNRHSSALVLITCIFAAFTLGFLLGRTSAPGDTIVAHAAPPVPAVSPAEATDASAASAASTEVTVPSEIEVQIININTATLSQLDSLPGIGPVIAQRILDYREQHGPFTNLSQLTLVEGIGAKRLAGIIDLITIE